MLPRLVNAEIAKRVKELSEGDAVLKPEARAKYPPGNGGVILVSMFDLEDDPTWEEPYLLGFQD